MYDQEPLLGLLSKQLADAGIAEEVAELVRAAYMPAITTARRAPRRHILTGSSTAREVGRQSEGAVTTPSDHLAAANRLLLEVVPGARGTWPQAYARLTRLALEAASDRFWAAVRPPVAGCRSRRAQILLLREHVAADVARQADYAWASQSRAGHHHSYELALSATELNSLRAEVQAVVSALGTV